MARPDPKVTQQQTFSSIGEYLAWRATEIRQAGCATLALLTAGWLLGLLTAGAIQAGGADALLSNLGALLSGR